jgi:hypothetical protein
LHDTNGYEPPRLTDYGDLIELTLASGTIGSEDGIGKTVQAGIGGVGGVSIGVFP